MSDVLKFSIEDMSKFIDDDDPELAISQVDFLSTKQNSHKINITEEILRRDAHTILSKFLVGNLNWMQTDVSGHETNPLIFGYFPSGQEIEFYYNKDNYLVARAKAVVSKIYATKFYSLFLKNNYKDVSVEMTTFGNLENSNGGLDIDGLNIVGCTVLADNIDGSCPDASMEIIQFSSEKAEEFYNKRNNIANELKLFAERRRNLAEKNNYKVDKSKDSMSDSTWGDVDKTSMRDKIMEASNKSILVKDVYMLVEAGWETAPSEKLKYPVMELKGGTFVYNRYGLASAKAYAEKENETGVLSKINALYKKLDLDEEKKSGDEKMSEQKFEIEGRKAWGKVIKKVESHEGGKVYVESIEKNHIIYTKDGIRYKVEADVEVNKDDKSVDANIKWNTAKKDSQQKMSDEKDTEDDDDDDDEEKKMSTDANVDSAAYADMLEDEAKRNEKILADSENEKDNIIMKYESELDELRKFRDEVMEERKMATVGNLLANIKDKITDEEYAKCEKEGMECKFADVSAWRNKTLANLAEKILKFSEVKDDGIFRMSAPKNFADDKSKSLWDRLGSL